MAIALALLVSADPITIEQFNHALQELSISPDVCQEAPASIRLLNCRKYDAVIVDLQLGEQSGRVLDEVRLSPSNRTAVTFAIGGSDAEATAVFRKKAAFVFERPLSAESNPQHAQACFWDDPERTAALFPLSGRYPRYHPETKYAGDLLLQREHQRTGMAMSTSVPLTAGDDVRIQFTLPDHKVPFPPESTICWWKTGHLGVPLCLFHGSTNTSSRIGYQKSWKKRFRNSSPGNSRRRTAAPYQPRYRGFPGLTDQASVAPIASKLQF